MSAVFFSGYNNAKSVKSRDNRTALTIKCSMDLKQYDGKVTATLLEKRKNITQKHNKINLRPSKLISNCSS